MDIKVNSGILIAGTSIIHKAVRNLREREREGYELLITFLESLDMGHRHKAKMLAHMLFFFFLLAGKFLHMHL